MTVGDCVVEGGLRIEGRRTVEFAGTDLLRMADVLETAAAVRRGVGERRADIKAWKMACSCNHSQMIKAHASLRQRVQVALGDGAGMDSIANRVQKLCAEAGVDDEALPFLADIVVAEDWDALAELVTDVEALRKQWQAVLEDEPLLATAATMRRERMALAQAEMARPVPVEVVVVDWDRTPCSLSGGYLRALKWMYVNLPEELAEL